MKNKAVLTYLTFIFVGFSVLLYPTFADFWNSRTQTKLLNDFEARVSEFRPEDFTPYFEAADAYNQKIAEAEFPLSDSAADEEYMELLNVNGSGIMGSLSIEKIRVELPVYHTTSDEVLSKAAGHMVGSSLPVGGESTHAVISAHRGLPSAKLFTNLDRMEVGDTFVITVLDRAMTYEVDQIKIVYPDEVENLYVEDGKDYVTLLTCTPYGLNTHRLLVRGVRVDTAKKRKLYITSQGYVIDPIFVTPVVAAPMMLAFLIYSWVQAIKAPKKKKAKLTPKDIREIAAETKENDPE